MLADFIPLLLALAVAALVYLIRERHRRRSRIRPARPDLTMSEAWDLWRGASGCHASAEVLEKARHSLLETGRVLEGSGMRDVRREILRSATTALYLETILQLPDFERTVLLKGYEAGMEPMLRDVAEVSDLRCRVLREYGRLKFDDAAPEDWFQQYVEFARPYITEKVRLAREFLVELNEGAARVVEIYDELLRDLERRLLESPPKKRFVPSGIRLETVPSTRTAPGGTPPRA